MDIKQKQDSVEKSSIFKAWKTDHTDAYLVHFLWFGTEEVSIGYYDQKADAITTFQCGKEIAKTVDTEIFKEQKTIPLLAIEKIKVSCSSARAIVEKRRQQNYSHDTPTKEIIILQTIKNKPIYNISIVTNTFKLLTIHINAETGDVEEEKIRPLMDFVETIENTKKQGESR
jgi:DNA-binding protein